jgi:hypothetical protein
LSVGFSGLRLPIALYGTRNGAPGQRQCSCGRLPSPFGQCRIQPK